MNNTSMCGNFDYIIVGAGITGTVFAVNLAAKGAKVLIVDRRPHVSGNCYDTHNSKGVLYHVYGPHIFHTNNATVVDYLSKFTEWYAYEHRALGIVNGRSVPVPFNLTSLSVCFESSIANEYKVLLENTFGREKKIPILEMLNSSNDKIRYISRYIYENIFLGYTRKQWGVEPEMLSPSVSARVPVSISYDDRYFQDDFQQMPKDGYTKMVERMLDHKNITVLLQTEWETVKNSVQYGKLIYTGTIDGYFRCCLGELPYRSLRFDFQEYAQPLHQPVAQVNYPNDHAFTRITEMAHLTRDFRSTTLVALEYPQAYVRGENEPYYPIPREENAVLFQRYADHAREYAPDVIFAGRLGEYKYYNMDQAIARALELSSELLQ